MRSDQFLGWLASKNQPSTQTAFAKPLIMGILNVTSDSFFDGGKFLSLDSACEHAFDLIEQGVDIIDIGGESTKPGVNPVPLEVELERIIPLIQHIRRHSDVCISIDTYKPEAMEAAVNAGANVINDIYALRAEGSLAMAARLAVPICLMHMQGQPYSMQHNPQYPHGVMAELMTFFAERIEACDKAGVNVKQLILDPGFGFGKLVENNLQLVRQLSNLRSFNLPILLGLSRKSTIGALLGKEVQERLIGSISMTVYAALHGANIIRTHDVSETLQALNIVNAICNSSESYN